MKLSLCFIAMVLAMGFVHQTTGAPLTEEEAKKMVAEANVDGKARNEVVKVILDLQFGPEKAQEVIKEAKAIKLRKSQSRSYIWPKVKKLFNFLHDKFHNKTVEGDNAKGDNNVEAKPGYKVVAVVYQQHPVEAPVTNTGKESIIQVVYQQPQLVHQPPKVDDQPPVEAPVTRTIVKKTKTVILKK